MNLSNCHELPDLCHRLNGWLAEQQDIDQTRKPIDGQIKMM